MTELENIVWGYGPMVLSVVALIVAVESFRIARLAYWHACELEAFVSRQRKGLKESLELLRPPQVG